MAGFSRLDWARRRRQHLVQRRHQAVFSVAINAGDQKRAEAKQWLDELLANVALVPKEPAEQVLCQTLNRLSVVHIGRGDADIGQLSPSSSRNRCEPGAPTQAILMSIYRTLKPHGVDPTHTVAAPLQTLLQTGKLSPLSVDDVADG